MDGAVSGLQILEYHGGGTSGPVFGQCGNQRAQQPDQPGGGLQGSTLFLLSVQEDPGNDPYPVPGRHQLAVAMDRGDSYEKKDKRIV